MTKYRLRVPTLAATVWHKHGDHPLVKKVSTESPSAFVRFVDLGLLSSDMESYGWIENKFGVAIVSSGDVIMDDGRGETEVVPAGDLELLYEEVK